MKKVLKFLKNTEGQALVEFAMVLLILTTLILGAIDVGWMLDRQIILTNLAREGARAAVVCNDETAAHMAVTDTIDKSSLTTATVDDLKFTEGWNNGNAQVILSVQIKPIVGFIYTDPYKTLTATAVMRVED